MQVQQYIYNSPSSSSVQVGRPDSNAPVEKEAVKTPTNVDQNLNLQTKPYTPSLSIENVAYSLANADVSSSLNTFSSLNAQIQGTAAYSVE